MVHLQELDTHVHAICHSRCWPQADAGSAAQPALAVSVVVWPALGINAGSKASR